MNKDYFEKIYDLFIEIGRSQKHMKENFVSSMIKVGDWSDEYVIGGDFGYRCKYLRGQNLLSPEPAYETVQSRKLVAKANERLKELKLEFTEK